MGYSPRGHKESDMTKHSKLKIPKVSAELELEPRPLPPKAQEILKWQQVETPEQDLEPGFLTLAHRKSPNELLLYF